MRIIFLILWLVSFVDAQRADTIDGLVAHAMKVHPSLQAIKHRLSAMDTRIEMSQNFENPDISLMVNDIQFDDPLNRRLEPMQFTSLNVKQKLPWFGKLEAKKVYTQSKKNLVLHSYDGAKVALAKEIRLSVYTIREYEERLKILSEYKKVAKQNRELYTAYASTQNKSHSSSIQASLLLSNLKIREQNYQAILKSQKSKLKYLVQRDIGLLKASLKMTVPLGTKYYLNKLKNNPNYRLKTSQKHVADAQKVLSDLAHTPDPYVKVGYYNRVDYPDYASVTVGMALPLYGTEKSNSELARKEILQAQSSIIDYKYMLMNEIETMGIKLHEAYTIYKIIQEQSLPQIAHMFDLLQSSIQNGGDLFAYMRLLEQKLALEEEGISIKAIYFRTQAKLNSLIGEL